MACTHTSRALSGGLGALLSAATGGHRQQSGDDGDGDDNSDDDDADDTDSPVRDLDTGGKRGPGPGGGVAVKAMGGGPVAEVAYGTPYTGQHGGPPPPWMEWSGPAVWQASIQAKRALLTETGSPGDVVPGGHRHGPPPDADLRMKGWGQPMPGMIGYPPPGTHGPQMSQMEMQQQQQYWRMQQLAAANAAGYSKPGTGLVAATSAAAAAAAAREGESAQSSDAEGVPADDVSRLRRRASLVDGAQVLAGMRIGTGNASAFYDGKATDTPMVSPTEEATEDEEDDEDLPPLVTKTSTATPKGRAAARVTGGGRSPRKPASSRSKAGGSKPARGGKSSSSTAAAAAAAAEATSQAAAISKAAKAEPSPASAAGKNSRAKETHRQAEQRRRGEQIKAVMELKTELDLHEGTPLGETLIQAAEHIRALQQDEHKLLAQIQSMKKTK